jgi:hypothetical protein
LLWSSARKAANVCIIGRMGSLGEEIKGRRCIGRNYSKIFYGAWACYAERFHVVVWA